MVHRYVVIVHRYEVLAHQCEIMILMYEVMLHRYGSFNTCFDLGSLCTSVHPLKGLSFRH